MYIMLAVARSNLDYICCLCFMDVRPLLATQKVYDIKKEKNMFKMLALTAYITILKNPINQKYINNFCRKICETCFVKIQYSYTFREKIMASTVTLKELEYKELNEQAIERLSGFCRICLNRLKNAKNAKLLNMLHINWLKNCSGIRFSSLIDIEPFRIKEGTNMNELAVINDTNFPRQLCLNCFKKLHNVEEFRMSTTKSFEYMISVMDGETEPEDKTISQPEPEFRKCEVFQIDNIYEENYDDMEHMINTTDCSNTQHIDNETFEDVMDFVGHLSPCSDSSNEESTLNLNIDLTDCNDDKISSIKKCQSIKSEQCNINTQNLWSKGNDSIKFKEEREAKQLKESKEESLEKYASQYKYESRHEIEEHTHSIKMQHECLICSKEFKRKSHLTDHIKAVHDKLKPFKCSHCSKTFSAKYSKRVHELQHTGDYPFVCNWCGKMFRRSNQLKVHLEIHTTNPELLCPVCKRSQKSQNDLQNHIKSHDDKRLQCPLCGKLFTRSSHLKDHHNAVHLKLRPFKCEFCESAFGDRKTRRIHEKTHTEDRPIKCSACKSGFNNHSALTKHKHQFCNRTENKLGRPKTKKPSNRS